MRFTNYLILCLTLCAVIIACILFVPSVGQMIESELLNFLSTNAS